MNLFVGKPILGCCVVFFYPKWDRYEPKQLAVLSRLFICIQNWHGKEILSRPMNKALELESRVISLSLIEAERSLNAVNGRLNTIYY